MAPRQPTVNVMPRRITNEDFLRALERTNRATTAAASQPTTDPVPTPPAARPSNRRNVISMDQLRSVLQRTSTPAAPVTTMDTTNNESANVQALLDQMRAMGLTDEAANRQALEATQWDLKAALDLLLGWTWINKRLTQKRMSLSANWTIIKVLRHASSLSFKYTGLCPSHSTELVYHYDDDETLFYPLHIARRR